jgi:hypothetical protein
MRTLLLALPLLVACQTVKEASLGYADAIVGSELPSEPASEPIVVELSGLRALDATQSPSLSRYAITREDIQSVTAGQPTLGDGCQLPFERVTLRISADELGPQAFARAVAGGDGCAAWTLEPIDLAPWFRQPSFTIDATVEGAPTGAAPSSLEVRVAFLVDVADKRV